MAQPELAQPRDEAVDAVLADRELGQRPPEHDRDPVRRVALELRREVRADERRPPAELDDVDPRTRALEQAVDLGGRQAAIDHVRQPPLARLGRALGDVEEAAYGDVDALSRPTITTTGAEPGRGRTARS